MAGGSQPTTHRRSIHLGLVAGQKRPTDTQTLGVCTQAGRHQARHRRLQPVGLSCASGKAGRASKRPRLGFSFPASTFSAVDLPMPAAPADFHWGRLRTESRSEITPTRSPALRTQYQPRQAPCWAKHRHKKAGCIPARRHSKRTVGAHQAEHLRRPRHWQPKHGEAASVHGHGYGLGHAEACPQLAQASADQQNQQLLMNWLEHGLERGQKHWRVHGL